MGEIIGSCDENQDGICSANKSLNVEKGRRETAIEIVVKAEKKGY